VGLAAAGGAVAVPVANFHPFDGMARWAVLGLIPVGGAAAAAVLLRRENRTGFIASLSAAGVVFIAALAALPAVTLAEARAPKHLVEAAGADRPSEEVRHGCYAYYQPSLVFYGRRELQRFAGDADRGWLSECDLPGLAAHAQQPCDYLATNLPAYLFVPGPIWDRLEPFVGVPHRELGRHYDFYTRCEIVVVTNR
jgi:hypothetical protein